MGAAAIGHSSLGGSGSMPPLPRNVLNFEPSETVLRS